MRENSATIPAHPALDHRCPFCYADPGEPCRTHRSLGGASQYPHSRRIALAHPPRYQSVRLPALCCECGNQRTVNEDYQRSADPNGAYSDQGKKDGWRFTRTLKCDECGETTRHAVLRSGRYGLRDMDEAEQHFILGGEYPGKYPPDRERLRADYFAKFPRNPNLSHRFWTKEADELRAKGETHMAALCGATAEIPRKWSTTERDRGELIKPDRIDWDTEYEDPDTGLWWLDMDCVDCLRVSNNRTAAAVRENLESWLSWFASHPDRVPDGHALELYRLLGVVVDEINEQK